jgi:hypothetical protein
MIMNRSTQNIHTEASQENKKYIKMVSRNLDPSIDKKHILAYIEVFGAEEFIDSSFLRQFVDTYPNKIEFAKEHYKILSELGSPIPRIRNKKEWEFYAQELFSKEYVFNRKCVFVRKSVKTA